MEELAKVEGSVLAMAEMSRHDRAIKLGDILQHAQDVIALHAWASGQQADVDLIRAQLLMNYPHLRERT